jgi:hypothetical protein
VGKIWLAVVALGVEASLLVWLVGEHALHCLAASMAGR